MISSTTKIIILKRGRGGWGKGMLNGLFPLFKSRAFTSCEYYRMMESAVWRGLSIKAFPKFGYTNTCNLSIIYHDLKNQVVCCDL